MRRIIWTARPRRDRLASLGHSLVTLAIFGGFAALVVAEAGTGDGSAGVGPDAEADRPTGQVARTGLGASVLSLAFSPDGGTLASTTVRGDVWLEDMRTGRLRRLPISPGFSSLALAFAPDGRTLAVAGEGPDVRLWDITTDEEREPLRVGGGFPRRLAFRPGGRTLAVGHEWDGRGVGGGQVVTLWDWRDHRRVGDVPGHSGNINALAFSRDGRLLASGDAPGLVTVVDVDTGRERCHFRASESPLASVVFSPDGSRVATAAAHDPSVRLWDAASGLPLGALPIPVPGRTSLAASPVAPILAIARPDGVAALWDIASSRELGTLRAQGRPFGSATISPDGRLLATGDLDGVVRLWSIDPAAANPPRNPVE